MFIGVVHDESNTERNIRLIAELSSQGIKNYTIFPAIHDIRSVKKGINLAHKSVVEYAQLADFDEVCVMEDDVKFTHYNSFNYFLSQKPIDFDLFLAGIYVGDILKGGMVKSFCGFHCYVVAKRFYELFLSVPEDYHIDRAMEGLGKFIVCNPFAAIQYNGKSSNTGKYENYDSLLAGRKFYLG